MVSLARRMKALMQLRDPLTGRFIKERAMDFLGVIGAKLGIGVAGSLFSRYWWVVTGAVLLIGGLALALYIQTLREEIASQETAIADLENAVKNAEEINHATIAAMAELEAEKERNEALLADRMARKTKEAERLGALVQRVLSHDATKECPVAPSLDDALDGLSAHSGGPQ